MDILFTVSAFLVAIFILVAVHEYGHFIVAVKTGITVEKFFVGFGPTIFSWVSPKTNIEYGVKAIPMGGFVKMAGEEPSDEKVEMTEETKGHYYNQPVWKRAAVAFCGPFANFLLAIFLFIVVFMYGTKVIPPVVNIVYNNSVAEIAGIHAGDRIIKIDGEEVRSWADMSLKLTSFVDKTVSLTVLDHKGVTKTIPVYLPPAKDKDALETDVPHEILGMSFANQVKIAKIEKDSYADRAGLKVDDIILSINGKETHRYEDVAKEVSSSAMLRIEIMNSSLKGITIINIEKMRAEDKIGIQMGLRYGGEKEVYRLGPIDSVVEGFSATWDMTVITVKGLYRMINGSISSENIGGSIAIADMAGKTASNSFMTFLFFIAVISVNLAVINLFPLPVLDGGLLVYYGIEAIIGKPVPVSFQEKAQMVGIFMLISLFCYAMFNDIMRFFS